MIARAHRLRYARAKVQLIFETPKFSRENFISEHQKRPSVAHSPHDYHVKSAIFEIRTGKGVSQRTDSRLRVLYQSSPRSLPVLSEISASPLRDLCQSSLRSLPVLSEISASPLRAKGESARSRVVAENQKGVHCSCRAVHAFALLLCATVWWPRSRVPPAWSLFQEPSDTGAPSTLWVR